MFTHNLGYPRIGDQRELKRSCENYLSGKTNLASLLDTGHSIRLKNWQIQKEAEINIIPCNDFSYYDHILDHAMTFGVIPSRFDLLVNELSTMDLYFSLPRGYQNNGKDVTAMEMTKWFDTNYHYIVPEFEISQIFKLNPDNLLNCIKEARDAGVEKPKPVIIGPVSFLKLGKPKGKLFDTLLLIHNLLPKYIELIGLLSKEGIDYVQIDEPYLCSDLSKNDKIIYSYVINELFGSFPDIHFILASYYGSVASNIDIITKLPKCTLHLDLISSPEQLDEVIIKLPEAVNLSLGIINGRNIWKNNIKKSLDLVEKAIKHIGKERIMLAPSCSLIHVPCDLNHETNDKFLCPEIKSWMSFARQKLSELNTISKIESGKIKSFDKVYSILENNNSALSSREQSNLVYDQKVQERMKNIPESDFFRSSPYLVRRELQRNNLNIPILPTTTIGSFPQTSFVRKLRTGLKNGKLSYDEYEKEIYKLIKSTISWQEEIGIDVLVHGEYERNDMVEYFGEQLKGFAFTINGWVQSYGTRCVKPPIIYGDVSRLFPMTIKWITYAQSQTSKPVKGMLTGPVTMLQWSFVRDDQPRYKTALQIALAIQDEVNDLEHAGIKIIQVDEPAIREGLPLRKSDWNDYLKWSAKAFRLSVFGVSPETQIHTHMCYSEFNDIIKSIIDMDADVITIEASRSQMKLLDAFVNYKYPNDIGPGIYDIHSPRIPTTNEVINLLKKAAKVIPINQLWINPDCGLKTRDWKETRSALINMVKAAENFRKTCR
jgi:5-methyltetrahydropteroyltriglutamate--homocysteine methyltransferase